MNRAKGPATSDAVFRGTRGQIWLSSPWPILLALCAGAALWLLTLGNPAEILEMRWMGQILRWRYEHARAPVSDPHIVHLDINRADLERMPSLESEYQKAADIIRIASALGAQVIAFDVIFGRGTEAMNAPILQEVDRARAQNRKVVFAEALLPASGSTEVERVRSFPSRERQRPEGLINVKADSDGIFRHYEFAQRAGNTYEPSLALASYLAWREVTWDEVIFPKPGIARWQEIGADFKSTQARDLELRPVLLNLRAPWAGSGPAAFQHYSLAQLEELERKSQSAASPPLDHAIVFVSYTGAGLGDVGTTPLAANQPRVILHSSALNDLIQHNWLRRSPLWADLLAIVAVALLGAVARYCRGTIPLIAFWMITLLGMAVLSAWLIVHCGWITGIVFAAIIWTVATGAEVARRYSNELIERLKLRATMSLYFSPRVMERVLRNPGSMEPQEAEVTVLLTDIRNSTPIAEVAGARGTFALLNQVFEAQTEAIMAEDGSLEHFLGDQFLSYWGAPDPQPDAADRAYRGALALIMKMERVRETLTPELRRLFGYGVALHSGAALLGNKGSAKRLDYGLVGDLINAAARVESLTKHYGILFLITHETFSKLSSPPPTRVVDEVIVKGKSTPLKLYEVRHPFTPANFEAITPEYNAAFALYRKGTFSEAAKIFRALSEQNDRPSKLMAERCEELVQAPPKDWQGIYELKIK